MRDVTLGCLVTLPEWSAASLSMKASVPSASIRSQGRTVTSKLQARTAWTVTFLTVVLLALSRVLQPPQAWQWTVDFITSALGNALIILACAGVGLLIVSRRPGNVIGW